MNRTLQPEIQELVQFNILPPVRTVMPNGVPLTIINAGEQDVVRVDILFGGGRWQQSQKLQALFANRMLREGSRKYTAAEKDWDIMGFQTTLQWQWVRCQDYFCMMRE